MNLFNYYYYFKSVLTPRFCDELLQYGKRHQEQLALTGKLLEGRDLKNKPLTKKELNDLKKKRDSNVVFLDVRWIYK